MKDFFISYTGADLKWAEWIAWHLEKEGYSVILQAWDAVAGQDIIDWMDQALKESQRVLGIVSAAYLSDEKLFSKLERNAALYNEKYVPIHIETVQIEGLFATRGFIDLASLGEADAKSRLLEGLKTGRKKPGESPDYPGTAEHTVPEPQRFPGQVPLWNLPHLRNPNFTGRAEVLQQLHQGLSAGQPTTLTQTITGLGGIGKTQTALEYAYRYAAEYQVIWWIASEESETIFGDYAALAAELDLPEKNLQDQQEIVKAVRRWLEQNRGWLLIFDNAVDPKELRDFLPRGVNRRVLITSRHHDWRSVGGSIALQIWPREESLAFVQRRSKTTDMQAADQLAEALGDLPLALEQAAAYINASNISLKDYLDLFTNRRKALWQQERPPQAYHQDTVTTTWRLAMAEVTKTTPIAIDILNFCAWLAPDKIPRALLKQAAEFLLKKQAKRFSDPLLINAGIQALNHYSLIDSEAENLSLHRLVQAVVQDSLTPAAQNRWVAAAAQTLNAAFPSDGYENPSSWPLCLILTPHALATAEASQNLQTAGNEIAEILNKVGSYFYGRAAYREAEALFRRSLQIYEAQLGPDHPYVAAALNNLAILLKTRGNYVEAEPLYRRALQTRESHLGPNHPDVAQSLNNLAGLLRAQGNYIEAEALYRRALEIKGAQLGPDHPSVATGLNNLAGLLDAQGKSTEAEPMYRRALQIRESHLGPNHPDVAQSLNNLGVLLKTQGKYAEAEPLYRLSLQIREAQLDPNHPDVAQSLNNLAGLLKDQGNYAEAEPLYRQGLEILEKALGCDHPDTITVRNNLEDLRRKSKGTENYEK